MKARRNLLSQFEGLMQALVEGPFALFFPSRLEPVEIMRKLERTMEDNTLLQGEGRRLAPTVYDIYLSIKDHQDMVASQSMLARDWQNDLIEYARRYHYTLRTNPVIRLHADSSLRPGAVRIEVGMGNEQMGGDMHTQALSAEQLEQLKAQLQAQGGGRQLPPGMVEGAQGYGTVPAAPPYGAPPDYAGVPNQSISSQSLPVQLPPARLAIRLPQGGQQAYRIEKPIINIGRQLSNDIIVEDKRVSRYHAQIKYQPDGQFVIFDLGSTNGITINSTPHMRQHVLRNGDHFTIGSYEFYFERR